MICRRVRVSGRVQGVSFRAFTRMQADRLRLDGHAINLSDGRVEVLVCGDAQAVDALVRWLHVGPPAARVDAVDVEDASDADCPAGFRIG
ncbi:MAG: acylphosphatase [Thiomonas sp.]